MLAAELDVAADHEGDAVPHGFKFAALQQADAQGGVAEYDHVVVDPLDQHEMLVAIGVVQHERRYAGAGEAVEIELEAVGAIAAALEVTLHVEKREAVGLDA